MDISFIANYYPVFFTFQTLPNPPIPITNSKVKAALLIYFISVALGLTTSVSLFTLRTYAESFLIWIGPDGVLADIAIARALAIS